MSNTEPVDTDVQSDQADPANRAVKRPPNRIIVVSNIYHVREDENPRHIHIRYGRLVKSSEQMYGPRECKATDQWLQLDTGWIKEPSLIVVQHLLPRSAKPSNAQLLVGVYHYNSDCVLPMQLVPAGEAVSLHPYPGSRYALKVIQDDSAIYSVTALPA